MHDFGFGEAGQVARSEAAEEVAQAGDCGCHEAVGEEGLLEDEGVDGVDAGSAVGSEGYVADCVGDEEGGDTIVRFRVSQSLLGALEEGLTYPRRKPKAPVTVNFVESFMCKVENR